jgi:hypothetical protein
MRKCLCLLIASLLCTTSFATEKLSLSCNVEGTEVSYGFGGDQDRFFSERIQIDIEPFVAPPENPDISFLSYKITVRGSSPASMTIYVPENSVSQIPKGDAFENKSNPYVLEYRYESFGKDSLKKLRIDRKTGFLEAHIFHAPINALPGMWRSTTVRYTGNCKKQMPSMNLF